jgi:hypothetical protein
MIEELNKLLAGKTILGVHPYVEDMNDPHSPKGIAFVTGNHGASITAVIMDEASIKEVKKIL